MSNQQSMNQQMEKEGGKPAIVKKLGTRPIRLRSTSAIPARKRWAIRLILDDCRKIS